MKRILITIVSIVVVLGVIGFILTNNKKKNKAKTEIVSQGSGVVIVNAVSVKKAPVELDFVANGNFLPNQDLQLSAEYAGRVSHILVDEGAKVTVGQVLAKTDDELLKAEFVSAEAAFDKLKKDKTRYENSLQTGGITQQQMDDVTLNLKTAEARYITAKRKLAESSIKSPINGTVNKRYIETGTFLTVGAKLFDIVDVSKLKLKVNANEAQVVNLKTGDLVTINCPVFADKVIKGKVSFIASKADASLNYPVEIQIENASNDLRAGMFASANFKFPKQAPAIVIPRSAFVGSVNSSKVYVVEGEVAKERKVVASRIIGDQVEIASGLEEGETVITSGQINLVDGSSVQVQK